MSVGGRIARIAALVAAAFTGAAVFVVVGLLIIRLPALEGVLRARVAEMVASGASGLTVRIGRVRVVGARAMVLEDVVLEFDGKRFVHLERLSATLSLRALLARRIKLADVTLDGLDVRLIRTVSGWRVPGAPPGGSGPGGWPIDIEALRVTRGRLGVALLDESPPRRFAATEVAVSAVVRLDAAGEQARVRELSFVPRGVRLGAIHAAGVFARDPDGAFALDGVRLLTPHSRFEARGGVGPHGELALHVNLAPLAAHDLRLLLPGSGIRTDARAAIDLVGTTTSPQVSGAMHLGAGGRVRGRLALADGSDAASAPWTGSFSFTDLDPHAVRSDLPPAKASGTVNVAGRGTRGVQRLDGRVQDGAWQAGVHAAIVPGREPIYRARVRVDTARLEEVVPSGSGRATAKLRLGGRGLGPSARQADLQLTVAARSPADALLGVGRLAAHVAGSVVEVGQVTVDGPAIRATGRATVDLLQRRLVASLDGSADLQGLRPPLEGRVNLGVRADGGLDAWVARLAVDAPDGVRVGATVPIALTAAATLRGGGAPVTGSLDRLVARVDRRGTWGLERPARLVLGAEPELGEFALANGRQRVTGAGRIGKNGALSARLAVAALEAAPMCAARGGPACDGRISGSMRLGGTMQAPTLEGTLDVPDLAIEGTRYGDLRLAAEYATCRAVVRGSLVTAVSAPLRMAATIPAGLVWPTAGCAPGRDPLVLELQAERVDLAFLRALAPDRLRVVGGILTANLRWSGRPGALAASGSARIDDGVLELATTGVRWQSIRIDLAASPSGLDVVELAARGGEGTLTGSGRIALDGLTPDGLDVAMTFRQFAVVRTAEVDADVTGDVTLGGTFLAPALEGKLDLSHLLLRPSEQLGSEAGRADDATIELVGTTLSPAPVPPGPSPIETAARLSLTLSLGDDAWLRRPDANLQLGGAIRVAKASEGPIRLFGAITVRRGTYVFESRRFTLERGHVGFAGELPVDPTLDIVATHRLSAYVVTVQVSGVASKPTLLLTSDPPLEQADILALLLFGRPVTSLGQAESATLRQQTVQLSTGYSAPSLMGSVREALGLDVIDVSVPQGTEAGHVVVGRSVTDDVFLSLTQEFGPRLANVVGVEYRIRRNLSARLSTSSRGDGAVDLFWHRRY